MTRHLATRWEPRAWLLAAALLFALAALVACDNGEDGDGGEAGADATTQGSDAPTTTATAAGGANQEQTATATGTPSDGGEGSDGEYSAALELALEDGIGSEDVQELVSQWNIDVTPGGEGLPEGSGTVEQGGQIYQAQCAACHGADLSGAIGPQLVSDEPGTAWEPGETATVGNWWPYATTVWDYINRAMPFYDPGSLSPDEVYALTAFILSENGIIDAGQEMNQDTLPQVEMPARDLYHACYPDLCYDEYGRDGGG